MRYQIKVTDNFGEHYMYNTILDHGKYWWMYGSSQRYDTFSLKQARNIVVHGNGFKNAYLYKIETVL